MIRIAAGVCALCAIYAAVLGSADVADLLVGAGASGAILAATRARAGAATPGVAWRPVRFVAFAGVVLVDVVRGTWQVALIVLGLRPLRRPGIVAVPIAQRSARGVAVSALALTLSPGSFLVDVDEGERTMLVHVIDATDPEAVRARFDRFYERWQRPVFP